jgi:signal transduction histidine kinase
MMKVNSYNRNSIIAGVLVNLALSILFIIFIVLGYQNTTENAAIQDDTFRTHFQSRLILKSINGLNHSRAELLLALKNKNVDSITQAEDHILGAQSNYQMLLSEQETNQVRVSNRFKPHFEEIKSMLEIVFEDEKNFLKNESVINNIISKTKTLINDMHDEESKLWVDEALKLHAFSKVKQRNLYIFYGLTVSFFVILLMFIYFTVLRYRLNKKINLQHERLVLQTRLSTLGMMSAELAHEINSPLMVIDGRLRILHNELISNPATTEKILKNIDIIKRNSLRIQGIIKSFKTMSKSGENDVFESLELSMIFEEVKDLVAAKLTDEHIEFKIGDINSDYWIEARRIQIVQVLTNLINNSMDAIKSSSHPWIKIDSEIKNDQIIILVTDSGPGISEEHVESIFDPFYSTKGSAEGTGLGLSISKKIMKEHGGDLVYNPDHPNTQFILTFKYKKAHS